MTASTASTSASTGITLSDVLSRHARVRPYKVAFVDPQRRCTFSELDERVTRLANALSARGVRRGDRVAVLGLNSLELVESWLAALRLGAVAVPVNFRLVPDEIAYVLADSGAVAVVVDLALAPAVEQARTRAPSVHTVLTIGADLDDIVAAASDVRHRRRRRGRGARVHHVHVGDDGPPEGRGAHPPQPVPARLQFDHAHSATGPTTTAGWRSRRCSTSPACPGCCRRCSSAARWSFRRRAASTRGRADHDRRGAGHLVLHGPGPVAASSARCRTSPTGPVAAASRLVGRRSGVDDAAAHA